MIMSVENKWVNLDGSPIFGETETDRGNPELEVGSFVIRTGSTPVYHANGEKMQPEAVGLNGIIMSEATGEWLSAGPFKGDSFFVLFPKLTTIGPFGPVTGQVQLRVPSHDLTLVE